MKKRMILALVFVMAGMAGAVTVLQISVNGDLNPADLEYSLAPGSQTLTLGIWVLTDEQFTGDEGHFALLVLNSQGTITGGYSTIIATPLEPWPAGPEEMNGVWGTTMPGEPILIPSGTVLFDGIVFHCVSAEDAVIGLYKLNEDFTLGSLMDQVVIDQSEPDVITTPTLVKTTAAPAIASRVNGGRTETFAASATSSLGHVLEYKFNWGDSNIGPWGAATQTHVYNYASAQTYNVIVQARCTVDGVTSVASAPLTLISEPVKSSAQFYTAWASTFSRPNCWAFKRNCRGDVDGDGSGIGPANKIWVNSLDLRVFLAAYNRPEWYLINCNVEGIPCICADNNRLYTGFGVNRIWVNSLDLQTFSGYYNKLQTNVPVCSPTDYWYWTN